MLGPAVTTIGAIMHNSPRKQVYQLLWLVGVVIQVGLIAPRRAEAQPATSELEQHLLNGTSQHPDDPTNWRLLGRLRLQRNDIDGALQACTRAVQLAPTNASAHFGLAKACLAANHTELAAEHFALVTELAPDSEYGVESKRALDQLYELTTYNSVMAPAADLEPNRFAGAPLVDTTVPLDRRWSFQLDVGAQYNSNVQLAPVSRVIVTQGLESMQGFLSPQLEHRFLQNDCWQGGMGFDGHFNVNESDFGDFDLQDYRPNAFLERSFALNDVEWRVRGQYDFTLDEFAGRTLGTRHAMTTMLSRLRPESTSVLYWSVDYGNFADDGSSPEITSLDGWTNTLGLDHTIFTDSTPWLALMRGGVDLQWADLRGQDYAYRGMFFYADCESPLPCQMTLALQAGWGFRSYPDFTLTPSRDEDLWRAGFELRRPFGDHWEVSGFYTYDRFASDNAEFDTSRYISGLMTTCRY